VSQADRDHRGRQEEAALDLKAFVSQIDRCRAPLARFADRELRDGAHVDLELSTATGMLRAG
jgi:hypothetical protein